MSTQSMAEAWAPIEARNRAISLSQTFGHLAPKPKLTYNGSILFTLGAFGDYSVIRSNFPKLPCSPWFFEHMNEFISEKAKKEGHVYQFVGTYEMLKDDASEYRFRGKVTPVIIVDPTV